MSLIFSWQGRYILESAGKRPSNIIIIIQQEADLAQTTFEMGLNVIKPVKFVSRVAQMRAQYFSYCAVLGGTALCGSF